MNELQQRLGTEWLQDLMPFKQEENLFVVPTATITMSIVGIILVIKDIGLSAESDGKVVTIRV